MISSLPFSRSPSLRDASTTCAPCSASSCAVAAPMPREAPVTIAMRPWRSNSVVLIAGSSCKSARQSMAGAWVLQMSSRILLDDDGTFPRLTQLALIGIAEPGADRTLEFDGSADRTHHQYPFVSSEFP